MCEVQSAGFVLSEKDEFGVFFGLSRKFYGIRQWWVAYARSFTCGVESCGDRRCGVRSSEGGIAVRNVFGKKKNERRGCARNVASVLLFEEQAFNILKNGLAKEVKFPASAQVVYCLHKKESGIGKEAYRAAQKRRNKALTQVKKKRFSQMR